jgi:cytochrome c-type biogenesis protein CcmF
VASFGSACLVLAFCVSIYGVGAALYGARARRPEWVASGRNAMYGLFALTTIAFVVLEVAFLSDDFHFVTVQGHSSSTTPTLYKLAAAWSSQEGSLLLWVWLLSGWSSLILFLNRRRMREITPYAIAVLSGFGVFFTALLVFHNSPFEYTAVAPADGQGLNALLRHPAMMIHPPMLYSGYTLFTIPFAFAVGALVVRQVDAEWISATRRFTLAAWFFLGVGILLGMRWSWSELGWGGYWAWDPVENASLMPWLIGTAFLHSMMIQEKRGMLKVWNASLALATGTLAIVGTFLVRSGILDSIHAFVEEGNYVAWAFAGLIGVMAAGSVYLVVSRRDILRSEHRLDSLLSREAMFMLNNIVLVGITFVVFWGTFFPLISEAVTGTKSAVGPPWFSQYIVPLAVVLVLLTGIGPVIPWRRATVANARRVFGLPAIVAVVVLVALLLLTDASRKPWALVLFAFGAFALAVAAQEFFRGTRARMAMTGQNAPHALVTMVRRNRRRYGGYIVHVGIAVLFIGVAASSAFQHVNDVVLQVGQSTTIDGYKFQYVRATTPPSTENISFGAVLRVTKDGKLVKVLDPSRGYYPQAAPFAPIEGLTSGEATSEVRMDAGITRDVWATMSPDGTWLTKVSKVLDQRLRATGGLNKPAQIALYVRGMQAAYRQSPPPATFRLLVSPLVMWIWVGGIVIGLGALVAMWPAPDSARRRARAAAAARVAQDLGRVAPS